MKRYYTLYSIMLLFLVGVLTACSLKQPEEQISTESIVETSTILTSETKKEEASIAETKEVDRLQIAEDLLKELIEKNYQELSNKFNFDATMQTLIEKDQLKGNFETVFQTLGELKERKQSFEEQSNGIQIIQIPCIFENQSLNFQIIYNTKDEISGITIGAFRMFKEKPENITEIEVELKLDDTHILPGTLTIPKDQENYPAVVLIHGSGASSRDEILGNITVFRDIAWKLAERGIASYRYDKRTYVYQIEPSDKKEFDIYDETVDDAVKAIKMLREYEGITSVFALGHSQGGEMMPAIAKAGEPDGCILLAAPAGNLYDTLIRQINFLQGLKLQPQEVYSEMLEDVEKLNHLEELSDDEMVMGMYKQYWQSLFFYNPIEEAKDLSIPVLVLQGEEDYQVIMEDFDLWRKAFQEKENWKFISYPRLTHAFSDGVYENGPTDYYGDKQVSENVIRDIAEFIVNAAK